MEGGSGQSGSGRGKGGLSFNFLRGTNELTNSSNRSESRSIGDEQFKSNSTGNGRGEGGVELQLSQRHKRADQ